jgi:uncharacterized protein (DUF2062 family)
MLSVMSVAYQDNPLTPVEGEVITPTASGHKFLFDAYLKRRFEQRRKIDHSFSNEQTRQWLSWLAQHLRRDSQTIFLIEGLQPQWLATRLMRFIYVIGSRLLAGLVLGTSIGFCIGMVMIIESSVLWNPMAAGALLYSLIYGALAGLMSGVAEFIVLERHKQTERVDTKASIRHWILPSILYPLIWMALVYVVVRLTIDTPVISAEPILIYGFFFTVPQLLVFGPLQPRRLGNDITTYELLFWSWSGAFRSMLRLAGLAGVLMIIPVALIDFAGFRAMENRPPDTRLAPVFGETQESKIQASKNKSKYLVVRWITSSMKMNPLVLFSPVFIGILVGGIIAVMYGGLTNKLTETKTEPNQGIKLTIRNAVRAAFLLGSTFGLIAAAIVLSFNGFKRESYSYAAEAGLLASTITGSLVFLKFGGGDYIKHVLLRALLASNGNAPFKYSDFLDHSSRLVFLQKVGGGYIFIHRLLLEYFADLPTRINLKDCKFFK